MATKRKIEEVGTVCTICRDVFSGSPDAEVCSECQKEPGVEEVCPICREVLGKTSVSLLCEHSYHYNCLNAWVRTSPTCPMCRAGISAEQIEDLRRLKDTRSLKERLAEARRFQIEMQVTLRFDEAQRQAEKAAVAAARTGVPSAEVAELFRRAHTAKEEARANAGYTWSDTDEEVPVFNNFAEARKAAERAANRYACVDCDCLHIAALFDQAAAFEDDNNRPVPDPKYISFTEIDIE